MGIKYCTNCNMKVDMNVSSCPDCSTQSFFHHDPNLPFPYENSSNTMEKVSSSNNIRQSIKPKKELDPVKLQKFQERFAKELEELEYLEWRSNQPGWRNPEIQKSLQQIRNTAAGVALGSFGLRYQLGQIQNNLTSPDSGSDSSWLGDLFN